jgi:hypothetical protein
LARARQLALATEWSSARKAQLVNAIESGEVLAPESVLAALKKIVPPERKRLPRASGAIESDLDILAEFVHGGTKEERIGAASCIAYVAKVFRAPPTPHSPNLLRYSSPQTVGLLKAALDNSDSETIPEVQRDLLKAFPVLRFGGDELLPVFVKFCTF